MRPLPKKRRSRIRKKRRNRSLHQYERCLARVEKQLEGSEVPTILKDAAEDALRIFQLYADTLDAPVGHGDLTQFRNHLAMQGYMTTKLVCRAAPLRLQFRLSVGSVSGLCEIYPLVNMTGRRRWRHHLVYRGRRV